MKLAVVCLIAISIIVVSARPQDQYTTKYDNIDVDQIIRNDRLLNRYIDCLMERNKVRCPPEAVELKLHISDALSNECAKCNDKQKEIIKKVIKHLVQNKIEAWNELKGKYDPDGVYAKKYEDEAKKENVTI